jgi:hypothetical protein
MNRPIAAHRLPYEAKARIADNIFLLRKHAGYSQKAWANRQRYLRTGKGIYGEDRHPLRTAGSTVRLIFT